MSGIVSGFSERLKHARSARAVRRVNALEPHLRDLPDNALAQRALDLRKRRRQGAPAQQLRDEMFALVREATRRALGIRQFDVQVAAAVALSEQHVIQMETGEGKTFVAPLAACLFALDGQGVHVLTANDYLVERDALMLAPVYAMLGFRVGHVLCDTPPQGRVKALQADVTYTTISQIGYDFLREYLQQGPESLRRANMWQYMQSEIGGPDRAGRCLRGRRFAIIDEVDNVLIDYARQPISIAEPARRQHDPDLYAVCRAFAREGLEAEGDFTLDRARRQAELTDRGKRKVAQLPARHGYMRLMDSEWEERVQEALAAEHLFQKGADYVVRGDAVHLVDPVSGRLMIGQRLGGEVHQALEAKENVPIRPRQTPVKKITVQSLVRAYRNLAGMTATAWEAEREFRTVYDMKSVRFAPRTPLHMDVRPDRFFASIEQRLCATADEVAALHGRGIPVLVGAWSVEESQRLAQLLGERGVPHNVLNAVDHKGEAGIIARAGEKGSVTVSTNMAGRGVEIPLGPGVEELGGLHVIGSGRHHLTRVDRQLAGRCARRGMPGSVQFYVSLEDDVFKVLPERKLSRLRRRVGADGAVESASLSRLVRRCQEVFRRRYALMRRALLARDMAVERTEQILFGQDRL